MASIINSTAWLFDDREGAKPPSSPTLVFNPLLFSTDLRLWYTSAPIWRAVAKLFAPAGTTMNSCKSVELEACLPPFKIFNMGTGIL
jgi:hypothetical protein